jgi:hypothetical protein
LENEQTQLSLVFLPSIPSYYLCDGIALHPESLLAIKYRKATELLDVLPNDIGSAGHISKPHSA